MVTQLVYTSRPRFDLSTGEGRKILDRIVESARLHNAESGVTGALIANDGWLSQVLEGTPAALGQVLNKILADDRHEGVQIVGMRMIPERRFADWSMGITTAPMEKIPGGRLADMTSAEFLALAGLGQNQSPEKQSP